MKTIIPALLLVLLSSCSASYATMHQPSGSETQIPSGSPSVEIQSTATRQILPSGSQAAQVTATETLYIRKGPSADYEQIGYLMHGETVTIYECAGVWARIGADRWVNALYLSESECK